MLGEQLEMGLPILTDTHIARRQDPETSHKAAKRVRADGSLAGQQLVVLAYVREFPDHTAQELADIQHKRGGKLDRYHFGRRLPALAADHDRFGKSKAPLVKKRCHPDGTPMERVCGVTGFKACTWVPVDWQEPQP